MVAQDNLIFDFISGISFEGRTRYKGDFTPIPNDCVENTR